MIAFVDKHFFKIHYSMWICMTIMIFMNSAVNAGYRNLAVRQAEEKLMAQIPSTAYSDLPLNLLLKVPVEK